MLLSPGRLPAGLGVTITALVCTGALGTPASAAAEGGSVSASGTTVHFTAAAGAANTVAVTRLGSTIVDDDEVPVEAGRGCRAVPGDDTRVRCLLLLDPTLINVSLGDRNDSLTNQTAVAVEATGGDGDDMLNDHAGNDGFYGGAGKDVVTYEFWTEDVVARLGGSGGNGSYVRGENDYIAADVEGLWGGARSDILTGDDAANDIRGFGGDDHIDGRAGDDRIDGGDNDTAEPGDKCRTTAGTMVNCETTPAGR